MDVHAVQMLYDYNYDTHDYVWECVMELTDEQFVAETDYSWRSIRNHLVHVMNTDNRWLARVQQQTLPDRLEPSDYPTKDAVREKWNEIRDRVISYVTTLTPAELAEIVEVDLPHRGGKHHHQRWEILVHVVNHGTDHRAQILARLHELNAGTIEQDMILYLWDKQLR